MALLQWLRASPAARRWQQGQGLVEYALVLVLIAVVVVLVLALFGSSLAEYYDSVIQELEKIV